MGERNYPMNTEKPLDNRNFPPPYSRHFATSADPFLSLNNSLHGSSLRSKQIVDQSAINVSFTKFVYMLKLKAFQKINPFKSHNKKKSDC